MPKKTLALICGLVLITFILFVIALNNTTQTSKSGSGPCQADQPGCNNQVTSNISPTNIVPAHSVLSILPQPIIVTPGQKGTVAVDIDTSDNEVTAVQLEVSYDPNFITNVKIAPGELFSNPVVLIDKNTVKTGRYTYAFGIMPNHAAITGKGHVAMITFTALSRLQGERSQLALLPTSLVTARGISDSVLKSATGTLVEFSK